MAIPTVKKTIARITNMVLLYIQRTGGTSSADGPTFRRKLERHKQALKDQQGVSRDDSVARNKARRTAPPPGGSSSSSAARPPNRSQPPHRLLRTGGGSKGPSVAAQTHRCSTLLA